MNPLFSTSHLARAANVSDNTVVRDCRRGVIAPALVVSGRRLFDTETLARYVGYRTRRTSLTQENAANHDA